MSVARLPSPPSWRPLSAPPGIVPESARWYEQGGFFQWTDIRRQTISRWQPGTNDVHVVNTDTLACAALPTRDGGTILVGRSTVSRLDMVTGRRDVLLDLDLDDDMRLNDAAADPQGRLWVGSRAAERDLDRGTLYRIDSDGTVHEELHGIQLSNGISWTPKGDVAYYADFRAHRVDRLTFDADGHVVGRSVLAEYDDLLPDGLTVDADGRIWIAAWESSVVCLSPDGTELLRWEPPAPRPTSLAFGGDGYRTLLLTTARGRAQGIGADAETSPLAGLVFVGRVEAQGVAPYLLDL